VALTRKRKVVLFSAMSVLVALVTAFFFYSWVDYRQAKEFCDSISPGSAADDVIAQAKSNTSKDRFFISGWEMRVIFRSMHSCNCQIAFESQKVKWVRAWCTD